MTLITMYVTLGGEEVRGEGLGEGWDEWSVGMSGVWG